MKDICENHLFKAVRKWVFGWNLGMCHCTAADSAREPTLSISCFRVLVVADKGYESENLLRFIKWGVGAKPAIPLKCRDEPPSKS